MRINHRIALNPEDFQRQKLESLGLQLNGSGSPLVTMVWLDVAEDNPAWPEVSYLIKEWDMSDVVLTTFTKEELEAADYLELGAMSHSGYPQPSGDASYKALTYDLTNYCANCGIGK